MTYRDILKNKEKQLRSEIEEAKDTAEVKKLGETLMIFQLLSLLDEILIMFLFIPLLSTSSNQ